METRSRINIRPDAQPGTVINTVAYSAAAAAGVTYMRRTAGITPPVGRSVDCTRETSRRKNADSPNTINAHRNESETVVIDVNRSLVEVAVIVHVAHTDTYTVGVRRINFVIGILEIRQLAPRTSTAPHVNRAVCIRERVVRDGDVCHVLVLQLNRD